MKCFVFKNKTKYFLVIESSLDAAYYNLALRQSVDLDSCKSYYKYMGFVDQFSPIKELKI